jgi:hypothetical protein
MKEPTYAAGALATLVVVGAAAWWWYAGMPITAGGGRPPAASELVVQPSTVVPPPAPLITTEAIERYPVPASAVETTSGSTSLEEAVTDLVGRKVVLSMMQTDDFAHRVAATVDNLGRERASVRLWPLNPVPGRFTVIRHDGRDVIDPDNGQRYTPYVLLLETLDLPRAVRLYFRFYSDFDRAYASLGYPGRHFNDRLVEVVDLLLATPDVGYPIEVTTASLAHEATSSLRSPFYEFEAPALQTLAAGQKILVRMGPVNARRVKGRLAELRALLTAGARGR